MYENMTFENIMERCLSRVSSSVDKREGSIVYDAIAPAAAELAIMYIELAYLLDRAFPDTETGDDLTKKCRERSVFRTAATYAVRKGYFEKADGSGCDLEIGTRFSGGDINFAVTERIAAGQYSLTAESAGAVGNEYVGTLFPIDYVPELAAARLADILIPGEDEESDDALRARYFESLESQAFGGNIADYKNKVELLPGVGAVKVFPVWNGGGTVKIVLVDSEWSVPSSELVEDRPRGNPGDRRRPGPDRPRRNRGRRHRDDGQRVVYADLRRDGNLDQYTRSGEGRDPVLLRRTDPNLGRQ